MRKHWYNTELPKDDAIKFKKYLKEHNIQYEPSEAYNLIHFECLMDKTELKAACDFLMDHKMI